MSILKILISAIAFTSIGLTANAKEKRLTTPHYYQDDGCWCGAAVVEMLEQHYRGPSWVWYSDRQKNLTNPSFNGGVKVGHTSLGRGRDYPCGPAGGIDTSEMLTMLNTRLDEYGKKFAAQSPMRVSGTPLNSKDFHRLTMMAVDNNDPVILAGHTRYKDGEKKILQHWYVIKGYKDEDGDPRTISSSDGYYILDSAYRAGLSHLITLEFPERSGKISEAGGKFVSHYNMVKYLAENNGYMHPIFQLN